MVVSGMQPSGPLHVGNYFGALKNWVELQNSGEYDCYFFIADYHTLTGNNTPEERQNYSITLAAECLSAGIDPKKSTLFVQSHIPEHTELAWIFNAITPMAELERMTQFKDKMQKQAKNVNVGLFTYPVLQAADILMYHAAYVPVGKDQVQHVELTNDIRRWFTNRYGAYFSEVTPLLTATPKIQSLLAPDKKMSKSWGEGHVLNLADEPDVLEKKIKKAVTASQGGEKNNGAQNLLTLLKYTADIQVYSEYQQAEKNGTIRYGDLKKELTKAVSEYFSSFREKRTALLKNRSQIESILAKGARQAHAISKKTIEDVRNIIGVRI